MVDIFQTTFKCIFLNETVGISIKISPKFVPKGPINNIPALVQVMAWRLPGDKPLSEPMMVSSLRPQWVNTKMKKKTIIPANDISIGWKDHLVSAFVTKTPWNLIGYKDIVLPVEKIPLWIEDILISTMRIPELVERHFIWNQPLTKIIPHITGTRFCVIN